MTDIEPEKRILTVRGKKYLVTKRAYLIYTTSVVVLFVYLISMVVFNYLNIDTKVLWYMFAPVFAYTVLSQSIAFRNAQKLTDEEAAKYRLEKPKS